MFCGIPPTCQVTKNCFLPLASLQVFQTSSEKIEAAGLAALTTLTSCLSRCVLNSDSEDALCTFLDLVLKGDTPIFFQLSDHAVWRRRWSNATTVSELWVLVHSQEMAQQFLLRSHQLLVQRTY